MVHDKILWVHVSSIIGFLSPTECEGLITVKPPLEVFDEGIAEWQNSLVGQFIRGAPSFGALQKLVDTLWGKHSSIKVKNGPWHIQNKPLILRKWEPNLRRLDFDLKKIPVWVQLYNVPLKLFSRRGLSYIASAIGVPLYMDTITASKGKLEFAKVCIEIEVGARFPKVIPVQLRDGTIVSVTVHIPWSPPSCSKCQVFGHLDRACFATDHGTVKEKHIWVVKNGPEAWVHRKLLSPRIISLMKLLETLSLETFQC
ncbi:hypothetical protein V6N13_027879 [Hibiscus sabdariffa]